ncbi:MAG: glycine cleavage system aminomethyltransferase GcvT [Planctomycetaceae bacterium]
MLRTPLCDWHHSHSGRMVDFAGWEMPVQYSSIVDEHNAVRQRAGLFDIAHMGRVFFTGPDAMSFLNHLLTNDVTQLKIGQVRYSLICNRGGGILDDVLIYRLEHGTYMLVVNASNREKILKWIEHHLMGYTLSAVDETRSRSMLALQGPQSLAILQPLADADLGGMKYYSARSCRVAGADAIVSRTGYTGEDGYEVIVENGDTVPVWDNIISAGQAHGLVPCGLGCRDTLRLEAAMPLYGHEMDERTDPCTAGLMFGVKLQKGDFIGRASIAHAASDTSLPRRVGLELVGRRIAREGSLLFSEDEQVGRVTSGTFSPTLQKSIAMGYLPTQLASAGNRIEVDIRGKRESAKVVPLPFYKRS